MCTVLEKLKEEARQEGFQEGRQEEIRDLVLDWTRDGYTTEIIAKLLKKPKEFIHNI